MDSLQAQTQGLTVPYVRIDDAEVDPGSPITHSLIQRLRDNPYEVVPDIATDGGLGIKSRILAPYSSDPMVNTVWDNQPGTFTSGASNDGVLTDSTGPFPACPRNGGWNAGLPTMLSTSQTPLIYPAYRLNTFVYYTPSLQSNFTSEGFFHIIFDGQTPVKLAMSSRWVDGVAPPQHGGGVSGGTVLTGLLSAADYCELDFGSGFQLLLKQQEGANYFQIEGSATVDLDAAYLNLKFTRPETVYSRGDCRFEIFLGIGSDIKPTTYLAKS